MDFISQSVVRDGRRSSLSVIVMRAGHVCGREGGRTGAAGRTATDGCVSRVPQWRWDHLSRLVITRLHPRGEVAL